MKKIIAALLAALLAAVCLLLPGCGRSDPQPRVVATTLPVYEFTAALCDGTDIRVDRLIDQNISCLHDYTLQVHQMQLLESADRVILSGAGLEAFLDGVCPDTPRIDASQGIAPHNVQDHHDHHHGHAADPHIWLDPETAIFMARNICHGLQLCYPDWENIFSGNLQKLEMQLSQLSQYAAQQLKNLSCRQLITFHDGFSCMAEAFGLEILCALEEESGSEASAGQLIGLIRLVQEHSLPVIFTELNGSDAAAGIVARETGCRVACLDMAISGDSYFDAMYRNIDTLKEVLE